MVFAVLENIGKSHAVHLEHADHGFFLKAHFPRKVVTRNDLLQRRPSPTRDRHRPEAESSDSDALPCSSTALSLASTALRTEQIIEGPMHKIDHQSTVLSGAIAEETANIGDAHPKLPEKTANSDDVHSNVFAPKTDPNEKDGKQEQHQNIHETVSKMLAKERELRTNRERVPERMGHSGSVTEMSYEKLPHEMRASQVAGFTRISRSITKKLGLRTSSTKSTDVKRQTPEGIPEGMSHDNMLLLKAFREYNG